MKKVTILFMFILCLSFPSITFSETSLIKVIDIEINDVVAERESSSKIEKEVEKVITSIKGIAVEVNPIPKTGYIIRIPLTKPLNIKNQWYDHIVNEVIVLYSTTHHFPNKVVLFTDENEPMFFDINDDLHNLLDMLDIKTHKQQ